MKRRDERNQARGRHGWMLVAAIAGATLAPAPGMAQAGEPTPTARPMRIGIIGAGTMGGGIGLIWAKAGHEVVFSSRHPEELADLVTQAGPKTRAALPEAAVEFGDVILIATPPSAIPQIGKDFSQMMQGKVVIDLTNPRLDRDGEITNEWLAMGTGLAMAQYLPGTRLVKAFNVLGARMLTEDAHRAGEQVGIPVAGDDPAAREIVAQLVEDAGFDAVIVGPLARAKEFDRGTPIFVSGMTAREVRETLKLPPAS